MNNQTVIKDFCKFMTNKIKHNDKNIFVDIVYKIKPKFVQESRKN